VGPGAGGQCTVANLAQPRTWRLTHAQIKNTLADVAGFTSATIDGFPTETRVSGYANQSDRLTVAPLLADQYLRLSSELATSVVSRAATFLKCPVASLPGGTCLGDFIRGFGAKMWRRPLADAEMTRLSSLYTTTAAQAGGPEMGLKTVVQALFMSPNFLYRVEVGNSQQPGTVTTLGDYELASALSYMLWDSAPDATLMDLAAQGKLHDPVTLAAQATRMLSAAGKAPATLNSFLQQ
jgi:hypothetical protein